jgi:predicted transcriptional regulator
LLNTGEANSEDRTSLDEAILKVIEALRQHGGLNVSQAAKAASLNWKTADKVLLFLMEISEKLEGKEIEEYDAGRSRMYVLVKEVGLEKMPDELQSAFIRS